MLGERALTQEPALPLFFCMSSEMDQDVRRYDSINWTVGGWLWEEVMRFGRFLFASCFTVFLALQSVCVCQHLGGDVLANGMIEHCDFEFKITGSLDEPEFHVADPFTEKDRNLTGTLVGNIQEIMNPLTNHCAIDWLHVNVYVKRVDDNLHLCCIDPISLSSGGATQLRVRKTAVVLFEGEKLISIIQSPRIGMQIR